MQDATKGWLFTPDHIWVAADAFGEVLLGLTEVGQEQLGFVLFADLPEPGDVLERGRPFAYLETMQEEREVVSPLSGIVVATNPKLAGEPHLINLAPCGAGWMVRMKPSDPRELANLWSAGRYDERCGLPSEERR